MKKLATAFLAVLAMSASPAQAHDPHEHGAAYLNLSVEEQKVALELKSALANFISFEQAPETEARKKEARAMAAVLNNADALFIFPAEAECRLERASLKSDVIDDELLAPVAAARGGEAEKATAPEDHDDGREHGNLEAGFSFVCGNPSKLNRMAVGLFGSFPALNEIEVQMVTPKGQGAAELTRADNVIRW